jgi:hypothetical protein
LQKIEKDFQATPEDVMSVMKALKGAGIVQEPQYKTISPGQSVIDMKNPAAGAAFSLPEKKQAPYFTEPGSRSKFLVDARTGKKVPNPNYDPTAATTTTKPELTPIKAYDKWLKLTQTLGNLNKVVDNDMAGMLEQFGISSAPVGKKLSDEDKAKITNAINAGIDEVFPYLSKSSQVRAAENLKPAGVKLEDWLYTVNKYKGQYPITQLAATVEKRYANRSAK